MRRIDREANQNIKGGDDKISAGEKGGGDTVAEGYIQDNPTGETCIDSVPEEIARIRGNADEILNSDSFVNGASETNKELSQVATPFGDPDRDYPTGLGNIGEHIRGLYSNALGEQSMRATVTDYSEETNDINEADEEPLTTELIGLADNISAASSKADDLITLEQILKILEELKDKKPPLYLLNSIKDNVINAKEELESSSYINKAQIRALQREVKQLYNHFHEKKIGSGSFPAVSQIQGFIRQISRQTDEHQGGLIRKPAANVMLVSEHETILTPELRRKIKEVGKLSKDGFLGSAMELGKEICDSYDRYQKLYAKGEHNFMKEQYIPDSVTQFILDQLNTGNKFQDFRLDGKEEIKLRFCELGSGMGNDAWQFAGSVRNIIGYHGIDGYKGAVDKTRERLLSLKTQPELRHLEVGIDHEDFIEWMKRKNNYKLGKSDERLMIHSKSTLHYYLEEIFRGIILFNLHRLAKDGKGLLSLSMKTPESSTWQDGMHEPIYEESEEKKQDGYLVGIHREEGQLRAFVTRDKLVRMVDEKFDVIMRDSQGNSMKDDKGNFVINENAAVETIEVPDYDFKGRTEVFTTILARPRPY